MHISSVQFTLFVPVGRFVLQQKRKASILNRTLETKTKYSEQGRCPLSEPPPDWLNTDICISV